MAFTSNAVTSAFWYIYEALRDKSLQRRMVSEVASCTGPGCLDISKLVTQPLLQSVYAEVLRLKVAIAMTRTCESEDFDLGGYRIPKGESLIIFNRTPALNVEAWTKAGRPPADTAPLEEFCAERFLVPRKPSIAAASTLVEGSQNGRGGKQPSGPLITASTPSSESESETEFSMDGMAGCWLPYGGGEQMCPGRHFAKAEIICTFAVLLSQYDLELTADSGGAKVEADLRFFPTGGLPPISKVPFRIRNKSIG